MSCKGAPLFLRGECGRKLLVHLAVLMGIVVISFSPSDIKAQCPGPGGVCATPGKNGAGGTLTGVVNAYYPGTANAAAGATSITVGPVRSNGAQTNITAGDLLLVIQIQGADINSNNTANYGDGTGVGSGYLNNANLTAGLYEFVAATSGVTAAAGGTINITGGGTGTGLINSYVNAAFGTQGERNFQVVRVPQYTTATLSSTLTAGAWDGSGGGILAIDVSTTLTLGGTVSVDGLGFRGGAGQTLTGSGTNTNNTDYRNTTANNFHGNKGEGIAGTPRFVINNGAVLDNTVEGYPNGSRARGAPGTAGGGGTDPDSAANDQNTGGGGGGNGGGGGGGGGALVFPLGRGGPVGGGVCRTAGPPGRAGGNGGAGGVGGLSWFTLLARGGLGGAAFAQSSACRIVMGGGGGSGTRNNDDNTLLASAGSAGGGIVMIRTRFVQGTGTITANGAD